MERKVKKTLLRLGAIITALLSVNCSTLAVVQTSQPPNSNQPILEISVYSFDAYSAWCKDPLYTRLYSGGRLERETCSKMIAEEKASQSKYVVTKKEYQLSAQEIQESLKFAEQSDFLGANPGYYGGSLVDTVIDITIVYRGKKGEKKIRLRNIIPDKNESKTPASLNKLWLEIDEVLKNKERS